MPYKQDFRVARSFYQRLRGCIGYGEDFQPLFIPSCQQIHTFWCKTPIDLFWVDEFGQVISVDKSVKPRKIRQNKKAYGVLEAPSTKLKLVAGESIVLNKNCSNFLFKNNYSGSVVTEFALIFPILILLVFGFLQLSLVLSEKLKLTHVTNYAVFTGAVTNDNTKISGALAEYYSLSDITYQVKNISGQTGNPISLTQRKHNDIISLEIQKPVDFSIPLMSVFHFNLETKASARVICTAKNPPYVCS